MTQRHFNLAPRLLPAFLAATAFAASSPPSWFYAVSASADSRNRIDARIVEAVSDGPDTLVRFIRIAPLTSYCPRPIVQVKEIHVRNNPLAGFTAKFNPCDIAPEILRASLKHYAKPGSDSDSPKLGFIARCATSTISFPIPVHESVDFAMLRREHPEWEHLWALTSGLREDASRLATCSTRDLVRST
jgi:hypothetical protein